LRARSIAITRTPVVRSIRWSPKNRDGQLDLVHPLLVEDEAFRQRWPLVGEMGLVADERDRMRIALGAKRRGGFEARLTGADDHAAAAGAGHQRCDAAP